jgi:large subunit ribosomal protein L30
MTALGLKKINSFNELELTPQIKGIVRKVNHLIKVENI